MSGTAAWHRVYMHRSSAHERCTRAVAVHEFRLCSEIGALRAPAESIRYFQFLESMGVLSIDVSVNLRILFELGQPFG